MTQFKSLGEVRGWETVEASDDLTFTEVNALAASQPAGTQVLVVAFGQLSVGYKNIDDHPNPDNAWLTMLSKTKNTRVYAHAADWKRRQRGFSIIDYYHIKIRDASWVPGYEDH